MGSNFLQKVSFWKSIFFLYILLVPHGHRMRKGGKFSTVKPPYGAGEWGVTVEGKRKGGLRGGEEGC